MTVDLNTFPHLQPLGHSIPANNVHAVSASMDKWEYVLGYEQGKAEIIRALPCGYPRFLLHPLYEQLRGKYAGRLSRGEALMVWPSLETAKKCIAYTGAGHVQTTRDGVALAVFPEALMEKARQFWQHAGLIVSSRQAEAILNGRKAAGPDAEKTLKKKIAAFYEAHADNVFLFPTGMGAIYGALQAVNKRKPGRPTVQLGFPYVDTHLLQKRMGNGCTYIRYDTPDDLEALSRHLAIHKVAGVFCEIPGNPLLRTVDLKRLKTILARHQVPLLIDDTLGPPMNVDVSVYADMQMTSLTKYASGSCNVMGGAVILNPRSPYYGALKAAFDVQHEPLLYPDDAALIAQNMKDFGPRMQEINANAERLADHLSRHPCVEKIFYPKGDKAYEAIRRPDGGYGGLFSIALKDPDRAPAFYDNLAVAKGPSLGNDFTLACPIVLLTHFKELGWAMQNGVHPHLIRVSVGRENIDELIKRFDAALEHARPATRPVSGYGVALSEIPRPS